MSTSGIDGRRLRSASTRQRLINATAAMLDARILPTARSISRASGVGLRTIFHHFTTLDDLYRACGYSVTIIIERLETT